MPANYQTVLGNGFAALASWGVVMPPGLGLSDDVGVFVGQDVRTCTCCPLEPPSRDVFLSSRSGDCASTTLTHGHPQFFVVDPCCRCESRCLCAQGGAGNKHFLATAEENQWHFVAITYSASKATVCAYVVA